MIFQVNSGQHVLVLWKHSVAPDSLQNLVESLQSQVGSSGRTAVENVERLKLSDHTKSSFDVILSGVIPQSPLVHNAELLETIVKLLKPGGTLVLYEPIVQTETTSLKTAAQLTSLLKVNGLVKVSEGTKVELTDKVLQETKRILSVDSDVRVFEFNCNKPNFEVGSSCQLPLSFNLKKQKENKIDSDVAKVWTLSAGDALDEELIDSDMLLDEDDLKKPDPSTLKVCGTTGKRKACKDCSCGLAEELNSENAGATKTVEQASACGNCYLGDAFRCASCPYAGMPPFKPGEKVALSAQQLRADV